MNIKIIDVTVHVIKSKLDTPFAFSQGWVNQRSATIVQVKTSGGIVGSVSYTHLRAHET